MAKGEQRNRVLNSVFSLQWIHVLTVTSRGQQYCCAVHVPSGDVCSSNLLPMILGDYDWVLLIAYSPIGWL